MKQDTANFDSLARAYRALEVLAFGRDLERARFAFLERLAGCRSILILGEGDGRFLARLLPRVASAHIHCIDSSSAMLARARQRIAALPGRSQVQFEEADVLRYAFDPRRYDAVVTLFFLDCFEAPEAGLVIERLALAAKSTATWLYADFSMPERGVWRLRARAWLAILYWFFRWQTGIRTRRLTPAEALICSAGFRKATELTLQSGLLRSVCFERS